MGIERIKLSVLMHTRFSHDIAFIFLTCYAKNVSGKKKRFSTVMPSGKKDCDNIFAENTIASQEQTPEHKA